MGYGQQDDPVPAYACSDYNLVTACVIPTAVTEMGLDSVKPCSVIASARVECPMRWSLNLLGLHFPICGCNNTYSAQEDSVRLPLSACENAPDISIKGQAISDYFRILLCLTSL